MAARKPKPPDEGDDPGTGNAVAVTDAQRGETIANDGVLNAVRFDIVQDRDYHSNVSLVDDSTGVDRTLFHLHPETSPITPGTTYYVGTRFTNLVVRDIPGGAVFSVALGPQEPPEEPPVEPPVEPEGPEEPPVEP